MNKLKEETLEKLFVLTDRFQGKKIGYGKFCEELESFIEEYFPPRSKLLEIINTGNYILSYPRK